ncbi:carbohydrate kinase [Candidatus Sumerlaeota bacterium]|nr:carbohydrate kinase [Candidatus Sumerlaeota bacterium]
MTNQQRKRIVAIGEILWDIIGEEMHIGGAPFNFAFHASQFGHDAWLISRVGNDPLGREILSTVRKMGLSPDHIQVDLSKPTGAVNVSVNMFGEPTFEVAENVAWDHIAATQAQLELVRSADVLWFNTLAQRSKASRSAIRRMIETALSAQPDVLTVFAANFRQQFYSAEIIQESLQYCRVLRLGEDELATVKRLLGRTRVSDRDFALELMKTFGILMVAVTYAARGCALHTPDAEIRSPGFVVDVVDTVGTGAAFTAAMIAKLLEGARFAEVARYSNLVGAYVATQPGATPRFDRYTLGRFELQQRQ